MQLASRNPLLRTGCCWLGQFSKAYKATPFKMHVDFRPLFRRTFAKIPLSADPSHQQGAHQRKSKHQGPWCLALAKPHFWKLGYRVGACFLRCQKATWGSTSGRCTDVLQDHGIWLWRSRGKASPSEAWLLYLWCGTIFLPDPGRQEVVALNKG